MKKFLKRLFHCFGSYLVAFPAYEQRYISQTFLHGVLQSNQTLLRLHYQELARTGEKLPTFDEIQFRVFSQNGEDGILLFLFSVIGFESKRCLEICAGSGVEANCTNLIVNHGWEAILFDGNIENVRLGRKFFSNLPETRPCPPRFEHSWITSANINELIANAGFKGEIDLLVLDMDGVDYWVWKAIEVVRPRVVLLEYNNLWGPGEAVTIPDDLNFVAKQTPVGPNYSGASLAAFVKLAREKGYRLVGCERLSFNAFFVRDGIGEQFFPEVCADSCLQHPFARYANMHRLPPVRKLKWVHV